MKKAIVKTKKVVPVIKKKGSLLFLLGGLAFSLFLLVAVLIAMKSSQDNRSDANRGSDPIPKCKVTQKLEKTINQKGNIVYKCVSLSGTKEGGESAEKTKLSEQKKCESQNKMMWIRNPDGKWICMEKCKSGEELGNNRNGKWGCMSAYEKYGCNKNEERISDFVTGQLVCATKCKADQTRVRKENGSYDCNKTIK